MQAKLGKMPAAPASAFGLKLDPSASILHFAGLDICSLCRIMLEAQSAKREPMHTMLNKAPAGQASVLQTMGP